MFPGGSLVKRLVLGAASAVASCTSLVVIFAAPSAAAPSSAAPFSATAPAGAFVNGTRIPAPMAPHPRRVRGKSDTSSSDWSPSTNWSGYAETSTSSGTFTQVTDTFVVPTVIPPEHGTQYVADWVGIGGYGDSTLVQTGIQAVVRTRRHQTALAYDAWTEVLPKPEKPLPLTISAGDTVTATVQETSAGNWRMEVDDLTTGASQGMTVPYDSSGASAEVINERPSVRGALSHLAHTPNITFGPGFYSTASPGAVPVEEPLLDPGANQTLFDIPMTDDSQSKVIATPSTPSSANDGFTVADGATPPSPPTV
jgi:hypothetical protein